MLSEFSESDCKYVANGVLNAELGLLKKSEAEPIQQARLQSTQEKMQSLVMKAPTFPNDVASTAQPQPLTEVKTSFSAKKMVCAEPGAGTQLKSPIEEQAQRKRFEEKQLSAQQHRDAVEMHWSDEKGWNVLAVLKTP